MDYLYWPWCILPVLQVYNCLFEGASAFMQGEGTTVLPVKSDSDDKFCSQLFSKTLTSTLHVCRRVSL